MKTNEVPQQYINKSVLVVEIEKRIEEYKDMKIDSSYYEGMVASLEFFRDEFINTLEVKEIDLEKAIDDYIYTNNGRKRMALELDWKCCNLTLKGGDEIIKFAKHFFELGLKAQKKEKV